MREEKKVHNEISCCNPGNLPAKRAHAKEQFDEGGIIREIPARLAAQDGIPATRRPRLSGVESMLGSGFGSSIHEYIYMENLCACQPAFLVCVVLCARVLRKRKGCCKEIFLDPGYLPYVSCFPQRSNHVSQRPHYPIWEVANHSQRFPALARPQHRVTVSNLHPVLFRRAPSVAQLAFIFVQSQIQTAIEQTQRLNCGKKSVEYYCSVRPICFQGDACQRGQAIPYPLFPSEGLSPCLPGKASNS